MTDADNKQAEQAAGADVLDTNIYCPDGTPLPYGTPAGVKEYARQRGITEAQAIKEIEEHNRANLEAVYGPIIARRARKKVAEKAAQAVEITTATVETIRTAADAIGAGTATKEDIAAMGQATKETTEMIERTAAEIAEITRAANTAIRAMGRDLDNTTKLLKRMAAEWAAAVEAFLVSPEWDELRAMFPDITEDDGGILLMTGLVKPIIENADALKARIKSYEDGIGHPLTFDDLINTDDDHITRGLTLLEQFLLDLGAFGDIEQPAGRSISNMQISALHYPLDKVNGDVWGLSEKDYEGKFLYAMETRWGARGGKLKRKPKEIILVLILDFSELEKNGITVKRKLTNFDKRVYIAIASLYFAGNDVVTLSEIHWAMGNSKDVNPSPNQLENIYNSITKMMFTRLYVDDRKEHETYNYDIDDPAAGWKAGMYDGPFLAAEFIPDKTRARGRTTYKAVHLFRVPALVSFAILRKQITTVDLKLLQAPQSKTEGNLAIEDYLLNRIAKAKNTGKKQEKILLETLYTRAGIETKKQKQRAPGKVDKYLQYYKEQGFIKRYDLQADSVTVYF